MTSRTRWRRWSLLLLLLVSSPRPASAQDVPPEQAEAVVASRLQDVLENAPPDRPVPWRDEASGLSGSIVAAAATFSGRLCRALRYTVQGASRPLAIEGERCREPDGRWVAGRVRDRIVDAAAASLAAPSPAAPSPAVRDLQAALHRLDYYRGPVDGVASAALSRALLRFEHDEQVAPEAEAGPDLLALAYRAIGRIPVENSCEPEDPVPDGMSAACGNTR